MNFDGSQTFGATSRVRLILGNDYTLVRPINGTLTIRSGLTIQGSGTIGNVSLPLVNQGTIVPDAGRSFQIFGSSVINAGTFLADGATLMAENLENLSQIASTNGGNITLGKAWSNHGTIDVTDATLNLGGSFTTADIGVIHHKNSAVNIIGSLDNQNRTLTLDAPGWQLTSGKILGETASGPSGITLMRPLEALRLSMV